MLKVPFLQLYWCNVIHTDFKGEVLKLTVLNCRHVDLTSRISDCTSLSVQGLLTLN